MITPDLQALTVPTSDLTLDPENARKGDIDRVKASLAEFGQRKPVVARLTDTSPDGRKIGVVEAGNTTLAAALALGWTEIAAVFVNETTERGKAYAITDNRTGELADWDLDQLAIDIAQLEEQQLDLDALGWPDGALESLLHNADDTSAPEVTPSGPVIETDDEDPADAPDEFPAYDSDLATDYRCPKCHYEWSGQPKPGVAE